MNAGQTGHPTGEHAIGVHRVRWINAQRLAAQCGGIVKFGDLIGVSKQQASHIAGSNPVRNIGAAVARRIEAATGNPPGWLDIDHEMLGALQEAEIALMHCSEVIDRPQLAYSALATVRAAIANARMAP